MQELLEDRGITIFLITYSEILNSRYALKSLSSQIMLIALSKAIMSKVFLLLETVRCITWQRGSTEHLATEYIKKFN